MRLCLFALSFVALFPVSLSTSLVRADSLSASLGQPLAEVSHAVDIRVADGVATYAVRRSFANLGARHEEARLSIKLPFGAAVTGLRIRGPKRWYHGDLMEVETARSLYGELTGMGPHVPRDPALLQWVSSDQLFPVAPNSVSTVEYTLTVPTRYANGRYVLYYPKASGDNALTAPVIRAFAMRGGGVRFDAKPAADGEPNVGATAIVEANPLTEGLEKAGSHKVSSLGVSRTGNIVSLHVKAEASGFYQGDLRIILMTPQGRRYGLHDQTGNGFGDVRIDRVIRLPKDARSQGRWSLIISDLVGMNTGTLEQWSISFTTADAKEFSAAASDTPIAIADNTAPGDTSGMHVIEIEAPPHQGVQGRLGRVAQIAGRQFLRLELDLAKELAPLPWRLSVVFIRKALSSARSTYRMVLSGVLWGDEQTRERLHRGTSLSAVLRRPFEAVLNST